MAEAPAPPGFGSAGAAILFSMGNWSPILPPCPPRLQLTHWMGCACRPSRSRNRLKKKDAPMCAVSAKLSPTMSVNRILRQPGSVPSVRPSVGARNWWRNAEIGLPMPATSRNRPKNFQPMRPGRAAYRDQHSRIAGTDETSRRFWALAVGSRHATPKHSTTRPGANPHPWGFRVRRGPAPRIGGCGELGNHHTPSPTEPQCLWPGR